MNENEIFVLKVIGKKIAEYLKKDFILINIMMGLITKYVTGTNYKNTAS